MGAAPGDVGISAGLICLTCYSCHLFMSISRRQEKGDADRVGMGLRDLSTLGDTACGEMGSHPPAPGLARAIWLIFRSAGSTQICHKTSARTATIRPSVFSCCRGQLNLALLVACQVAAPGRLA